MADWGPIDKNTGGPNSDETGNVVQPGVNAPTHAPRHSENYDATDGRHSKTDHQGWESVDPRSGPVDGSDWANSAGRFEDGPGVWRQT